MLKHMRGSLLLLTDYTAAEQPNLMAVLADYGMEPVPSLFDGQLLETVAEQGQKVNKGDVIAFVK